MVERLDNKKHFKDTITGKYGLESGTNNSTLRRNWASLSESQSAQEIAWAKFHDLWGGVAPRKLYGWCGDAPTEIYGWCGDAPTENKTKTKRLKRILSKIYLHLYHNRTQPTIMTRKKTYSGGTRKRKTRGRMLIMQDNTEKLIQFILKLKYSHTFIKSHNIYDLNYVKRKIKINCKRNKINVNKHEMNKLLKPIMMKLRFIVPSNCRSNVVQFTDEKTQGFKDNLNKKTKFSATKFMNILLSLNALVCSAKKQHKKTRGFKSGKKSRDSSNKRKAHKNQNKIRIIVNQNYEILNANLKKLLHLIFIKRNKDYG